MQLMNRILCGLGLSACLLMAQGDPPGRVARLSYVYGAVSYLPAGVEDWAPIDFNRPLTTGDRMFVEFAGTAELQTGNAALRMKTESSLEFLNLDDLNAQLRLAEGSLIVRLRYLGDQESFEIDTPSLAFSLLRPGEYRIDVKADGSTFVTVRSGEGEITSANQAFSLHAGQQEQVFGGDQPNFQTLAVPPPDQFDTWSEGRDLKDDQSPSARYVSRQMVGYQDLDQYGSWRTTPDYGAVWVPNNVQAGWAPYHTGHWLWVDPWGWTWVDDAPWGFAPFHYGRWAFIGGSWGWVPGPVAATPVYAPALVAWVGGGAAIGGGIAWFALGPREVYVPSYHTSPAYVNRVNITNTVIVNNVVNVNVTNVTYVNRAAPGAVMAVQQTAFASARPVQTAAITVNAAAIKAAPVVATAAIAPTRASIAAAPKTGAKIVQPPPALMAKQVVAKRTPPPPPVPFAQKQQALAANAGRPLDTAQVQQLRQAQPAPPRPQVKQVAARPVQAQPPAPSPQAKAPQAAPPPANRPPAATPESRPAPTPQTRQTPPPAAAPETRSAPAPQAKPATPPPASNKEAARPAPGERPGATEKAPPKTNKGTPKKEEDKDKEKDKKE
jgi:hypothetical protein